MQRAGDLKETWRRPEGIYCYSRSEAKALLEVPFVICSETNLDWNSPDPKHNTMFHSAWYAEELRALILDGNVNFSVFFAFAAGINRYGMILDDPPHTPWHPYYLNSLIGNNLDVGDPICQTLSDEHRVSTLAWRHETDCKLLLINKIADQIDVTLNLSIAQGTSIKMQQIVKVSEYEGNIVEKSVPYTEPLRIDVDGYSVILLTFTT